MDALIVNLLIIIAYSLFILIVAIVRARNGSRVARFVFMHISVMYFFCLLVSSLLPTALSSGENSFVPFEGLTAAIMSGEGIDIINYLSHQALNLALFIPFGLFVSVMCILRADNVFFSKVIVAGIVTIIILEVVQSFLPYRSLETDDFIFELIGVSIGYLIVKLNRDKKRIRDFLANLL